MKSEDLKKLAAPFDPKKVSFRVGATNARSNAGKPTRGAALAYIDARDVMERLDEVAGPAGWQNQYSHANLKTVCDLSINVDGEWISKADGAGDTEFEAEKGSLSGAFKRAAVRWGIGRYLYEMPAPWVDLDQNGQIKDDEMPALQAMLAAHSVPKNPPPVNDNAEPLSKQEMYKTCEAFRRAANMQDFDKAETAAKALKDRMTPYQYSAVRQELGKAEARLTPPPTGYTNGHAYPNGQRAYRR